MKIFISGGCKNGKSSIAEDCCVKLAGDKPLYYIATMIPFDDEDRERIKRHIKSRDGKNFITIEQGTNLCEILKKDIDLSGTFLLDSVTALLINEMYSMHGDSCDETAAERVSKDLETFANSVGNAVFVSDYIYEDMDVYGEYTLKYMEALATCDKALAKVCDAVSEITIGTVCMYKGELPL